MFRAQPLYQSKYGIVVLLNCAVLVTCVDFALLRAFYAVLDAVVACTFRNGDEQSQAWKACSAAMLALCRLDSPLAALRTRELCMRSGGPPCCMLLLTDELAKSVQGEKASPLYPANRTPWP